MFKSIQGEGMLIGVPCFFIRLSGCNLRCRYCDTKYAWNDGEEMSIDSIVKEAIESRARWVTITGGEPLLQLSELDKLVIELKRLGFRVAIETNASVEPSDIVKEMVDLIVASPKLPSFNPDYLGMKLGKIPIDRLWIKFVITDPEKDFHELIKYVSRHVPLDRLSVQPNSYTISYTELVEYVLKHNLPYRVLPQLHKIIGIR
ncbi:MAG: 7-carboxy-7-deazaguanine synthase QueE [Ignisphaera sp.]